MATQSVKDILDTEIPKPSFVLSPSVPAPLPSGVTVTRNGPDNVARTLDPYSGKFEHVPEDTPRVYGSDQSLLVEAASRTNHVKNSSDASGYFGLGNGSVSILDASGELLTGSNADSKRIESGGATNDRVRADAGSVTSGTETASFLAEKGSSGKLQVQIIVLNQEAIIVDVDFANESETIASDNGNHIDEVNGRYYKNGPNGNKRIALTIRYSGYSSGAGRKVDVGSNSSTSGEDVVFYHAQIEEAPNASSPIVTGGSPTTRAADDYAIFEGAQPPWWNPNEGTFYVEYEPLVYKGVSFSQSSVLKGDQGSFISTQSANNSNTPWDAAIFDGDNFHSVPDAISPFQKNKVAVSFTNTQSVISAGGTTNKGVHNGSLLNSNDAILGRDNAVIASYSEIIYIPRALPESTLNLLTS